MTLEVTLKQQGIILSPQECEGTNASKQTVFHMKALELSLLEPIGQEHVIMEVKTDKKETIPKPISNQIFSGILTLHIFFEITNDYNNIGIIGQVSHIFAWEPKSRPWYFGMKISLILSV